jgi:hypothetical protein
MTKGGQRPGAGRPARPGPKAQLIWCGQISAEDRRFIIANLTPTERYHALMAAAQRNHADPPLTHRPN